MVTLLGAIAGLPLLAIGGGGCTRWRIGHGAVAGCHCWGIGGGGCTSWRIGCGDVFSQLKCHSCVQLLTCFIHAPDGPNPAVTSDNFPPSQARRYPVGFGGPLRFP